MDSLSSLLATDIPCNFDTNFNFSFNSNDISIESSPIILKTINNTNKAANSDSNNVSKIITSLVEKSKLKEIPSEKSEKVIFWRKDIIRLIGWHLLENK